MAPAGSQKETDIRTRETDGRPDDGISRRRDGTVVNNPTGSPPQPNNPGPSSWGPWNDDRVRFTVPLGMGPERQDPPDTLTDVHTYGRRLGVSSGP